MPYRTISLSGEPQQVDVATGTMTVQTPWGIVTAQANDVLIPWGNGVVPMPSGLLDRLEARRSPAEEYPSPADAAARADGEMETGIVNAPGAAKVDIDALSRPKLIKYAAMLFPAEQPWVSMKTEDIRAYLKERGF